MQLSDWILGWIVDKNLRIRGTLECLVLTGAQATAWQPQFFCPPCGCLSRTLHSRGTEPLPNEIDTSSSWRTARTSRLAPAPIVWPRCVHLCHHQCRWKSRPDIRWQRCQPFQQKSCWCILRSWLVRWLDRKTSFDTWSDHIGSWTRFFTHPLRGFSFNGRYRWDRAE